MFPTVESSGNQYGNRSLGTSNPNVATTEENVLFIMEIASAPVGFAESYRHIASVGWIRISCQD
jgi:hypothetical protein